MTVHHSRLPSEAFPVEMLQFNLTCHKSNPNLETTFPKNVEHIPCSWKELECLSEEVLCLSSSHCLQLEVLEVRWCSHVRGCCSSLAFCNLCDIGQVVEILLDSVTSFLKWGSFHDLLLILSNSFSEKEICNAGSYFMTTFNFPCYSVIHISIFILK